MGDSLLVLGSFVNMTKKWLRLGCIGRPHGVRGGVFIAERADALGYSVRSKVLVCGEDPARGKPLKVASQKLSGGRSVLQFVECPSRDDIEALKGQALFIRREDTCIDDSQEYFWEELVGLKVVDCDNDDLGVVERVSNFGASDILSIVHSELGRLDLPFVHSYFDLHHGAESGSLRLIVSKKLFDECWETD